MIHDCKDRWINGQIGGGKVAMDPSDKAYSI